MGDQHVTLRPLSNQRKLRYPMSTMKSSLSIGCMMGLVWFGVGMTVHAASVSDFPSCPFPDTEVSTNVVLSVGNENTRVFSLTLELDASVSNCVEVAFGCDRNADGVLDRLETDASCPLPTAGASRTGPIITASSSSAPRVCSMRRRSRRIPSSRSRPRSRWRLTRLKSVADTPPTTPTASNGMTPIRIAPPTRRSTRPSSSTATATSRSPRTA